VLRLDHLRRVVEHDLDDVAAAAALAPQRVAEAAAPRERLGPGPRRVAVDDRRRVVEDDGGALDVAQRRQLAVVRRRLGKGVDRALARQKPDCGAHRRRARESGRNHSVARREKPGHHEMPMMK